jgi:hypothetical protein
VCRVRGAGWSMQPDMTSAEFQLFRSVLCKCQSYVEWGAGGSTYQAALLSKESILTAESDPEWIAKVREKSSEFMTVPILLHADIGPTKEFGYPSTPKAEKAGRVTTRWCGRTVEQRTLICISWTAGFGSRALCSLRFDRAAAMGCLRFMITRIADQLTT